MSSVASNNKNYFKIFCNPIKSDAKQSVFLMSATSWRPVLLEAMTLAWPGAERLFFMEMR
jgi:hypothetical protein